MPRSPSKRVPKKFRDWSNLWVHRLGLDRSWEISYKMARHKRAAAIADWVDGYQNATISFDEEWASNPEVSDTTHEHVVIHEHVHLLTARISDAVLRSAGEKSDTYKAYCDQEEAVVDQLATVLQRAYSRRKRVI